MGCLWCVPGPFLSLADSKLELRASPVPGYTSVTTAPMATWHSMLQRAFPADCGVCFGYCWPNPWLPRGALGVVGSQPSPTSSQASAELWSKHKHSTGNGSTSEEQCGQGCHCPCCATHREQPCFLLLMSRHIILIKLLFQ